MLKIQIEINLYKCMAFLSRVLEAVVIAIILSWLNIK